MKKDTKTKSVAIRFDNHSYEKIGRCAEAEHRGVGSFVRHATLLYVESFADDEKASDRNKGATQY